MAKKFADLRAGMSPQAQVESATRAEAMLRSMEVPGGVNRAEGEASDGPSAAGLEVDGGRDDLSTHCHLMRNKTFRIVKFNQQSGRRPRTTGVGRA